jgi:hypothetical protein
MADQPRHPDNGQFVVPVNYTPPPNGAYFPAVMPTNDAGAIPPVPGGYDAPAPTPDPVFIDGVDDQGSQ